MKTISTWVLSWALIVGLAAQAATPVLISTEGITGQRLNRKITISPENSLLVHGTNVAASATLTVQPTNGIALVNLLANDYTMTIDGVSGSFRFSVPDTNVTCRVELLATTLPTYTYTNQPGTATATGELVLWATIPPSNVVYRASGATGIDMTNQITGFVLSIEPDTALGSNVTLRLPSGIGTGGTGASGGSSASPTNNDTRSFTMQGPWSFPGGITAPGLAGFSISAAIATSDDTPTALWLHPVVSGTTLQTWVWVNGGGIGGTNSYSVALNSQAVLGSNNVITLLGGVSQGVTTSDTLSAHWATNTSNIVLYVTGHATEAMQWIANGYLFAATNPATAASPPPAGGIDPTTLVVWPGELACTAYYCATNVSALSDGAAVNALADGTTNGINLSGVGAAPTKQTDTGKAVVRFNGTSQNLYSEAYSWGTWTEITEGTIIMRIKSTDGQSCALAWGTGTEIVRAFLPFDGTLYFDWGDQTSGRVSVTCPSTFTNTWHNVVLRKAASGVQSIRVDGIDVVSTGGKTALPNATSRLWIGYDGQGFWWAGDMRAVCTFRPALSDSDADGVCTFLEELTD